MLFSSLPVSLTEWLVCCGTTQQRAGTSPAPPSLTKLSFSLFNTHTRGWLNERLHSNTVKSSMCVCLSSFLPFDDDDQSAALCWMQSKAAESRSEQFEGVCVCVCVSVCVFQPVNMPVIPRIPCLLSLWSNTKKSVLPCQPIKALDSPPPRVILFGCPSLLAPRKKYKYIQ